MIEWIDLNAPCPPTRSALRTLCEARIARAANRVIGSCAHWRAVFAGTRLYSSIDRGMVCWLFTLLSGVAAGLMIGALIGVVTGVVR